MDAFVKSELSDGCTVEFFHPASNSLPEKS